jgi:hypothetical protein
MAYASVPDVEARLDFALTESEVRPLELFLSDFSVALEVLVEDAGKDISSIRPQILNMIVAQRGRNFVLTADQNPGLSATSQTVGDTATSNTYRGDVSNRFSLTNDEKRLLGLLKTKIFTIKQY